MKTLFFILIFSLPLFGQQSLFSDQSSGLPLASTYYGNHGVSVIDFDKDGWDDIFFANIAQTYTADTSFCVLLKNNKNGTFTNVTSAAKLKIFGSYKSGVWGDINNDGYVDLFLAEAYGQGRCHLFVNKKDGTFQDQTTDCGINFVSTAAIAAFGDYNNDGTLDLFLATEYPEPDHLYKNISNGSTILFQDVTTKAGIAGAADTSPMQVTFIDYDNDGDLDIYKVHDGFLESNLFSNNGDGTFTDVSHLTGLHDYGAGNSMGVYWKDFDFDGWEEVYITRIGKGGLYKRQSNGVYKNVAESLGVQLNGMSWGIVWEDFDNDMDNDLYMINTYGFNGLANLYYEFANGTFLEKSAQYQLNYPYSFYGLAAGDFNNDGYIDMVASATDGNNKLLLNTKQKSGNWFKLSLTGVSINAMAVGAKVTVVAGGKRQTERVTAGNGYASQMSPVLHFGLGSLTTIDTLEIMWSKNNIQKFTTVGVNVNYRLTEGSSLVTAVPDKEHNTIPDGYSLGQNFPNPFNPSTTISYQMKQGGFVSIIIFDILGRTKQTVVNTIKEAGYHSVSFDASLLPTGIYYYRMQTGDFLETKKMVYLK